MSSHWMLTATGREYVLSGPACMIGNPPALKDIAHHLAQINRFTGACSRPYSVAEHSLLVERIGQERGAAPIVRLALLMHDAHEAYTTDLSTPAKMSVGMGWHTFEGEHAINVRHHLGLRTALAAYRKEVRACDLIALATERRDLTAYDTNLHTPWPVLDTPGQIVVPHADTINPDEPPLAWRDMRDAFLNKYLLLRELVNSSEVAP